MSIEQYTQLSFFAAPETNADPREPITVTWNMHHGCNRYVVLHIISVMRFYSYVEQV